MYLSHIKFALQCAWENWYKAQIIALLYFYLPLKLIAWIVVTGNINRVVLVSACVILWSLVRLRIRKVLFFLLQLSIDVSVKCEKCIQCTNVWSKCNWCLFLRGNYKLAATLCFIAASEQWVGKESVMFLLLIPLDTMTWIKKCHWNA